MRRTTRATAFLLIIAIVGCSPQERDEGAGTPPVDEVDCSDADGGGAIVPPPPGTRSEDISIGVDTVAEGPGIASADELVEVAEIVVVARPIDDERELDETDGHRTVAHPLEVVDVLHGTIDDGARLAVTRSLYGVRDEVRAAFEEWAACTGQPPPDLAPDDDGSTYESGHAYLLGLERADDLDVDGTELTANVVADAYIPLGALEPPSADAPTALELGGLEVAAVPDRGRSSPAWTMWEGQPFAAVRDEIVAATS